MSKMTRTAEGLASQLEPILVGALGAVNRASDFDSKSRIENLGQLLKLAVKMHEAGLSKEVFRFVVGLFPMEHKVFTGGSVEFAAAVSSGVETTEGTSFNVKLIAGGSLAGFTLGGEAGYGSDSRRTGYERSQQNLQLRVDWATIPATQADALIEQIAAKVLEHDFSVPLPEILVDSQSPILEAIESYLPVLKELFTPVVPVTPVVPTPE